jgi:hypothetical protein
MPMYSQIFCRKYFQNHNIGPWPQIPNTYSTSAAALAIATSLGTSRFCGRFFNTMAGQAASSTACSQFTS